MKQAIKKFCEDESINNGLFLLDMPTGFGKTHSVLDYIFDSIKDESCDKKFFFVTTLKKNLPIEDLRNRFVSDNRENEFDDKVIFLDSNSDCVVNNFTSELAKSIPSEIKKTELYKTLKRDIEFVQKLQNKTGFDNKNIRTRVFDELRTKSEPAFRRYITSQLLKDYNTIDERLQAIKTNKKWQWLGKLYPAVFTRDKKVVFLSADKFISRNSTIVEPSYMFYNNDILKNAIVFIDEFDAVKETMLNSIIQNAIKDKIDFLELFKEIYSSLHTTVFTSDMTRPSEERMRSEYAKQSPMEIIDRFKEISDEIYNDYSLKYNHMTKFISEDINKNFLFQDHKFQTIYNEKNKYIISEVDTKSRINYIDFVPDLPSKETSSIFSLLGKLRGFISYFQTGVNILATNYLQLKKERQKEGEDEFTREAAIRSILNEFHIKARYVDYLTSSILISSYKSKDDIENSSEYDLSVYEKGFRYYSFVNDINHDMQSKIMMCNFTNSPEKLLLRFCEKAKVVGISATATVQTVIGNFDIDYLKLKLRDHFKLLNKDDKKRLESEFNANSKGYNDISINAKFINGLDNNGVYSLKTWEEIYDDKELAQAAFEAIERLVLQQDYHKLRYVRIIRAFKEFVIHQDIQSFLCMLTMHPKALPEMDWSTILKLFKYFVDKNGSLLPDNFKLGKNIVRLDGEEYDSQKDKIISMLSAGEKVFVISVYQTVGAGQNLQYEIDNEMEKTLIKTNDFPSRREKDFDAIYLDKPTNVITNLSQSLSEEMFVKYIFQHELLQQNGEINQRDNKIHIGRAFKCFITQSGFLQDSERPLKKDSELLSYKAYATRTLIQAVGRICRTNLKSKNIYIFADESIKEIIDSTVADERLLNKEFSALLSICNISKTTNKNIDILSTRANVKSDRANAYIKSSLLDNWNIKNIQQWRELRSMVLKYPTMNKEYVSQHIAASNFYVELPERNNVLYYNQRGDYSYNLVSFSSTQYHTQEVSQTDARLEQLMKIKGVKECFYKNGWATKFEPNDFIMTPAVYNNIYKGALGEVVGWFILKNVLQIKLKKIEDSDVFEVFDYKVNDDIYVDFKHWKETYDMPNLRLLDKINLKLAKCKAKSAFIINIIAEHKYDCRSIPVSNGTIYVVPSLYINENLNIDAVEFIRRRINELSD